jgi:hypothetical protein
MFVRSLDRNSTLQSHRQGNPLCHRSEAVERRQFKMKIPLVQYKPPHEIHGDRKTELIAERIRQHLLEQREVQVKRQLNDHSWRRPCVSYCSRRMPRHHLLLRGVAPEKARPQRSATGIWRRNPSLSSLQPGSGYLKKRHLLAQPDSCTLDVDFLLRCARRRSWERMSRSFRPGSG